MDGLTVWHDGQPLVVEGLGQSGQLGVWHDGQPLTAVPLEEDNQVPIHLLRAYHVGGM